MKKFMAILATTLVMALSATSVFAAESRETTTTVKTEAGVEVDVKGQVFEEEQLMDAYNAAATVAFEVLPEDVDGLVWGVVETVDISKPADWDGKPVKLTISVDGIEAGDNAVVVNYNAATKVWDSMKVLEVGKGYVVAEFTHFSPVMIATFEEYEEQSGSWYYDPAIDGPVDPSLPGAATSPKTGVLPVAAFAATICLAGAAVCGKKVR